MDAVALLESRVASLETALRRSRAVAFGLAIGLLLMAVTAFVPQAQDEVTTRRLVLTDELGGPALVLRAGPQSSLILESPTGVEVLRIGGPPARRIGH